MAYFWKILDVNKEDLNKYSRNSRNTWNPIFTETGPASVHEKYNLNTKRRKITGKEEWNVKHNNSCIII